MRDWSINWWTVALSGAAVRAAIAPSWVGLAVLALLLMRAFGLAALRHAKGAKLLADTARLATLETEVRALANAQSFKQIGR